MLIKVISELVIVFCIVLAIMGIPSQTITKTVKEPVKETHCWCGGIPESLKDLNAKYHLSTYDIEQIDTKFYAPKMIEYQETTSIIIQWIDRLLIVVAYLGFKIVVFKQVYKCYNRCVDITVFGQIRFIKHDIISVTIYRNWSAVTIKNFTSCGFYFNFLRV